MKGEVFFKDENHMVNEATVYGKIFYHDEIEKLEDRSFNRETVFLLSQYLVGNASGAFNSIRDRSFNKEHEILNHGVC